MRRGSTSPISAAAHPGIGLVVDAGHVFRAGTSLAELRAALSPEMIFGVELVDAAHDVIGTLFEDTVHHRLLCGEGSFDLRGLVALVRQAGRRVRANGAVISKVP